MPVLLPGTHILVSVQNSPNTTRDTRVEDRLQAVLLAGRMATWEWDPESDILVASPLMDSICGLPAGESLTSAAQGFSLLHPEDRESHRALVQAAVRSKGSWHNEFRIIRPCDGTIVWLEELAHFVRNPATGGAG